jgi:hypothetical protein
LVEIGRTAILEAKRKFLNLFYGNLKNAIIFMKQIGQEISRGAKLARISIAMLAASFLWSVLSRLLIGAPLLISLLSFGFQALILLGLWQGSKNLFPVFKLFLVLYVIGFLSGLLDVEVARAYFYPFMQTRETICLYLIVLIFTIWCFCFSKSVRDFYAKQNEVKMRQPSTRDAKK